MGYTWTDGELITATKLNNTGGGGTSGLVTDTSDELDKTYNELMATLNAGALPFIVYEYDTDAYAVLRIQQMYIEDGTYTVTFSGGDLGDPFFRVYVSSTADGTLVLD